MEYLFTVLTQALSRTPVIASSASFIWGILSILLSPCHLASIPLIVGFIGSQGEIKARRAFFLAFLFSLGILITICIIGLVTGMLGRMMGDVGWFGNYFVAVIFLLIGLYLLDALPLPFLPKGPAWAYKPKGYLAALILGLVFGIALGPCTFAYMIPILGVAWAVAANQFLFAISLIFAYALGHCSVIVVAGTMTEVVQKYLNWNEKSNAIRYLKKACGILIILGGLYLLYTAH